MLEIYDDERLVGRLSVFDNARKGVCYEFSYDESFLKSENAFVIDKNLALNAQIYKSTALWGCFKDCLPDRWGNLVLKRLFGSALSEFELLLCVSDFYRQGSLRFKINADCKGKFDKFLDEFKACFMGKRPTFMEKISSQNATLAELDALFESAMRVELDEYDESDLVLLQACGAALGGARAKACVVYQNELYLVKFALPNDDFSVILWEKTLLDLAHLAGIKAPKSRLVALKNGQKALMIKRFDRINSARLPFCRQGRGSTCKKIQHKSPLTQALLTLCAKQATKKSCFAECILTPFVPTLTTILKITLCFMTGLAKCGV